MTYNDVFLRRNILLNIPLVFEGNKLPKSTAASVMLLRVAYQNKVDEFIKFLEETKKGFKKEGFDERAQAVSQMEEIDRRKKAADEWKEGNEGEKPTMPTTEELEKAEKTKETLEEFNKEKKELEEQIQEAQNKKAAETVKIENGSLSKAELADIYDMLGADGDIDYSVPNQVEKVKVPKEWLLNMIATNLVG